MFGFGLWPIIALGLVFSHGFSFVQGYKWANKDHIIKQQTAKIRHQTITNNYYKNAAKLSNDTASEVANRLEEANKKLDLIEADIKAGRLGKACSDKLFERLR